MLDANKILLSDKLFARKFNAKDSLDLMNLLDEQQGN
jgi:hypothetical protein